MSKEEIIAERKRQVDEKMNLTPKEEERIQLKRSFIEKFEGTLPDHKIATYIQIENKFWVTVLYHLAVEVPLISR